MGRHGADKPLSEFSWEIFMEEKEVKRIVNEVLDRRRETVIKYIFGIVAFLIISCVIYIILAKLFLTFVLGI